MPSRKVISYLILGATLLLLLKFRWCLATGTDGAGLAGLLQQRPTVAAASLPVVEAAGKNAQAQVTPVPGAEMDRLKFLLGDWKIDGEYASSTMVPNGGKETGWYKARSGPGGFSLIADFEAKAPEGPEIGHEILTWDPNAKAYKIYTVGNFPGAVVGTARWEGNDLVIRSEFTMGTTKFKLRSLYSDIREKSAAIQEWFQPGNGPEELLLRMRLTKK